MTLNHRFFATGGLVVGDLVALLALRPDARTLAGDVAAPHTWLATVGADQAAATLCTAALWCLAVWLGVGLLSVAASRLPGRVGRTAHRLSSTVLPAALYRAVAGAAGLGVLLAPVAAAAAAPPARLGGQQAVVPAVATSSLPAPTWPSDPPRPAGRTPTLPAPTWPRSPGPASPATPAPLPRSSAAPSPLPTTRVTPSRSSAPRPDPRHSQPPREPAQRTPGPRRNVVVGPGDSLWHIAAARLGPRATAARIATSWPRWYAANRSVIGADPDLILPGQRLHAPTATEDPQ